jgi:hypothetical protein
MTYARLVRLGIDMDDPVDCDPVDYDYVPFDEPQPVRRTCEHCGNEFEKWARRCETCWEEKFVGPPEPPAPAKPVWGSQAAHQEYLARKERRHQIDARRSKAANAVSRAVRIGDLRPARELSCVDCGVQAFCYDHRDYSKPLDVEPVCKRCDCLRGAAAPYDGYDGRWLRRMQATAKRLAERATGGQISRHDLRPDIFGPAPATERAA